MKRIDLLVAATLSALLLNSVMATAGILQSADQAKIGTDSTLYERLGGIGAIEAMVDEFTSRVTTDTVIMANRVLANALATIDMQELRYQLVSRICDASGGPCEAPAEWPFDMPKNLGLTEAQWTRAVSHLQSTMIKYHVPQPEQDALLGVMEIARRQVVKAAR